MARFAKHDVISRLLEIGLLPVFYNNNLEISKKIVESCEQGGAKLVEFTNRGDLAYEIFKELIKWSKVESPDLILGVGTIIDPVTAVHYINSGANFIVGPVFNPEIAKICNRRKVVYVPGCFTPSEISSAEEMGAEIIKLFPGKTVTPYFIKALLGPCPWSRLMPSGGVEPTRKDVFDWISAGATALNMGSKLLSKDLIHKGDFSGISRNIKQCILWINEARSSMK